MLKGFKEFIMRGNIVELAVAFVIGAAFQKVVSDFVTAIVTPILNALPGAKTTGWGFYLRGGKLKDATLINFSTIINSVVVFLMTAAVVYFILVLPMNKFNERRARGLEPEPVTKAEDIALLEEIRDLLKASRT